MPHARPSTLAQCRSVLLLTLVLLSRRLLPRTLHATAASDAIHHELQDLLRHGELSVSQQTALLASVKERQAALARSI